MCELKALDVASHNNNISKSTALEECECVCVYCVHWQCAVSGILRFFNLNSLCVHGAQANIPKLNGHETQTLRRRRCQGTFVFKLY